MSRETLRKSVDLPNSAQAAVEDMEFELKYMLQELSFLKKETQILQAEEETIAEVAKQQQLDIERYLRKETSILNECVQKQSQRQKAETARIYD